MGRVMALDLALRSCGYCLLDGDEQVLWRGTTYTAGKAAGLGYLYGDIALRLEQHEPSAVVVEVPGAWMRASESTSTATLEALLMAWGVCQASVINHSPAQLVRWDPSTAKELITGSRHADKRAVQRALELEGFDLGGYSEHEIDALAIALAWQRTEGRVESIPNGD